MADVTPTIIATISAPERKRDKHHFAEQVYYVKQLKHFYLVTSTRSESYLAQAQTQARRQTRTNAHTCTRTLAHAGTHPRILLCNSIFQPQINYY